MKLVPGLYEALVTRDRAAALKALEGILKPDRRELTDDTAPAVLAHHLHALLVKALKHLPEEGRLDAQLELANRLVALLADETPTAGIDDSDQVQPPPELLLSLRDPADARLGTGAVTRPTLSLRQSDLIVNGPKDLRLGAEIRKELDSADRVDLLVAFLKWSGLRVVQRELERFCRRRPTALRILTTTYLGASEPEALDALADMGADIRVSYESRRTRLHAKAWLFHRDSGYSTGLVGSSNLSRAALLDGCEWNVRLSAVDNPAILSKFQATFDQYWDEGEFESYDRERFLEATARGRDPEKDALASAVHLRAYPHQQEVLDALERERASGHTRNLVVAATGTGKTVVAALDYARIRKARAEATLLFVAHRQEILRQSQATFRAAVRDGHFGELLVAGNKPVRGEHVFASIQSLHAGRLDTIAPDAYDVVIVDEFHHAEAKTYRALLERLKPAILVGLTATPERADGKSILEWFDHRVAAELRLWDALDQGLLSPLQYFGVHDGTDLSWVDWKSGRYDTATLEKVYTGDHVRADAVLRTIDQLIRRPNEMRALGFCVSVRHARFMAEYFQTKQVAAAVVTGDTPNDERARALSQLATGEINVLFTVDVFNEGVDVPAIDTVLFLRPTESATVFLQQLGRGLRLTEDKDCLTVLDFIGGANRKFRFDLRYRALVGGTRAGVRKAVENGFPHLPAGCEITLDRESQRAVLRNIRDSLPTTLNALTSELAATGDVGLREFLRQTELEPEDLYRGVRTYTSLLHRAGLRDGAPPDVPVARALSRMLHVDDPARLNTWRMWLAAETPPIADADDPHQLMLYAALGYATRPVADLADAMAALWATPDLRRELAELLDVLADRQRRRTVPLADSPFHIHATYSRDEISAGLRQIRKGKLLRTQGGVYKDKAARADILYVTLQKNEKEFTPTTLYDDYPISPTRFHWESQSVTRADSETGRRYQEHEQHGWRILLFVRQAKKDDRGVTMPYLFLGPVRYVTHESEKPMRVTWALEHAMPPDFYRGVKVAAG